MDRKKARAAAAKLAANVKARGEKQRRMMAGEKAPARAAGLPASPSQLAKRENIKAAAAENREKRLVLDKGYTREEARAIIAKQDADNASPSQKPVTTMDARPDSPKPPATPPALPSSTVAARPQSKQSLVEADKASVQKSNELPKSPGAARKTQVAPAASPAPERSEPKPLPASPGEIRQPAPAPTPEPEQPKILQAKPPEAEPPKPAAPEALPPVKSPEAPAAKATAQESPAPLPTRQAPAQATPLPGGGGGGAPTGGSSGGGSTSGVGGGSMADVVKLLKLLKLILAALGKGAQPIKLPSLRG
jgi:hypothetical protein